MHGCSEYGKHLFSYRTSFHQDFNARDFDLCYNKTRLFQSFIFEGCVMDI